MPQNKPKLSTTMMIPGTPDPIEPDELDIIPIAEAEEEMTDEEYQDRVDGIKAGKTKPGRAKNPDRLPWAEARAFMHTQMITSRTMYEKWWMREKPKTLSRFPYRVYGDEWTSWNDYLGNNNKFNEKIGTKWKPMLDAIPSIHALKLSSQKEWLEYYALNKDTSPALKDVPTRPDLVYDEWRSWGHWLGNKPVEAIVARQETQRVQVYSIIHYVEDPINVLVYGIDPSASSFKERYQDQGFEIVKTYWYKPEFSERIMHIVSQFSSPYMEQQRQRITPNVYDIIWHLDQFLDPVLRSQVQ